jgi:ubiquinone/menaquinone biosynthesis C-methylase UbiE
MGTVYKESKLWDRFADGYNKQPIADETAYQRKLEVTQQYLRPYMNLVEIGCGTGGTSLIHAPHVKHILATDYSAKMVEIAQKKAEDSKIKNVEFRRSSVEDLDLPDGSQDAVLALNILHLLKDKDAAMHKVHRWLKPGGLFVTSTGCISDMTASSPLKGFVINRLLPVAQWCGIVPKFYSFTKQELKESFNKAGFGIENEWQPKEDAAVFIVAKKFN